MIACKRSVVFTLFILLMFILMPGFSSAWEKVENVRVEQVEDDVHIYYDLRGDADKYKVTVRGSSDGGRNYRLPMKTVSGDVGKKVRPGSGKKIIWKALKDAGELEGDEFVFEVEAVSGPGKEFVNSIEGFSKDEVYASAKQAFDQANFEAAREEFQRIIKQYPKSRHASNAQFWIGEIYYREKWYEKAILEYQKVIEKYPKGNKVPASILKQGFAFLNLGEKANARFILKELVLKHPKSNEAKIARQKLKRLK